MHADDADADARTVQHCSTFNYSRRNKASPKKPEPMLDDDDFVEIELRGIDENSRIQRLDGGDVA